MTLWFMERHSNQLSHTGQGENNLFNSKNLTTEKLTRKEVKWWPKNKENRKSGYSLIMEKEAS